MLKEKLCYRSFEVATQVASKMSEDGDIYHVFPRNDGYSGFEVTDSEGRPNEMPLVSYRYKVVIPDDISF